MGGPGQVWEVKWVNTESSAGAQGGGWFRQRSLWARIQGGLTLILLPRLVALAFSISSSKMKCKTDFFFFFFSGSILFLSAHKGTEQRLPLKSRLCVQLRVCSLEQAVSSWVSPDSRKSDGKKQGRMGGNDRVGWVGKGAVSGSGERGRLQWTTWQAFSSQWESPATTRGKPDGGKSRSLANLSVVQVLGLLLARGQASSYLLNLLERVAPYL